MSGNSLTILSGGTFVRGDVYSQDVLVIEGGIEGNIVGNRVIVKPQGWVHGDLTCRSLSIESGGVVDGAIKVSDTSSLPSPAMVEQELLAGQEASSLIEVAGILGEEDPPRA
ncbi:MAG: polymer-forming cytoskeletal protein [Pseudomonadota bacterium]